VYGPGTQATVFSACGQCRAHIEFELTVTNEGAVSQAKGADTLREWDPLFTAADRTAAHVLDGF